MRHFPFPEAIKRTPDMSNLLWTPGSQAASSMATRLGGYGICIRKTRCFGATDRSTLGLCLGSFSAVGHQEAREGVQGICQFLGGIGIGQGNVEFGRAGFGVALNEFAEQWGSGFLRNRGL